MRDDPVPVRRAAIGCLVLAVVGLGIAGLVRPLIFSVAPPRDDSVVIVGQVRDLDDGPFTFGWLLDRSYGYDGEVPAAEGRVQVELIVAESSFGSPSVVNAASPVEAECPVEIGADRLVDCADRTWTYDGFPITPDTPPLERFAVTVEDGRIVADLTRTVEEDG